MKKAEYIKKYGFEKYVIKTYRPKYRAAALIKYGKEYEGRIAKPKAVSKQPPQLREWFHDVKSAQARSNLSWDKAKKEVFESSKYERRRKFRKYPRKVRDYIHEFYDKKRDLAAIAIDRDFIDWIGES
ncbi:hypothetical protein KAU11_03095 [Candidatus Babeliales bacterium]|nr:hypothetical protein [Candidatus Babeliales bacterium]